MSTIFVRGFDFGTAEAAIRSHCASVGPVKAVEMMGKGGAHVTYKTPAAAQKSVDALNGSVIPGNARYVDVKIADKQPAAAGNATFAAPKKRSLTTASEGSARVFIRGFDFGTTDEQFEEHCSSVGTIVKVQWCTKGSAIVTYSTQAEAQAAVDSLNQTVIEGNSRYIDVIPKEAEDEGRPPAKRMKGAWATPPVQFASSAVVAKGKGFAAKGSAKGGVVRGKGAHAAGAGRVFVRGFDFGTTDEQFEGHMSQAGNIVGMKWVTKGSVEVTFSSKAEAEMAASMLNQTVIDGNTRYIDVLLKDE